MMDDFSDHLETGSSTNPSQPDAASASQTALAQGLAALKQKNYSVAIAHLKTVCRVTTSQTARVKAQMGLIKAYAQTGALDAAMSLCQPLCHSQQSAVRAWATQTWESLLQRSPAPNDAGFVPLHQSSNRLSNQLSNQPNVDQTAPTVTDSSVADNSVADNSVADSAADAEIDLTGFTPISAGTPTKSRQVISPAVPDPASPPLISQPDRPDSLNAESRNQRSDDDLQIEPDDEPDNETDLDNPFTFASAAPLYGTKPSALADQEQIDSQHINQTLVETVNPDLSRSRQPSDSMPEMPETPETPDQISDQIAGQTSEQISGDRPTETTTALPLTWRQSGRAQKWSTLGQPPLAQLWLLQAGTAIALITAVWILLQPIVFVVNRLLNWVTVPINLSRFALTEGMPLWLLVVILGGLFFATPWLLDALLQRYYSLQPLSLDQLSTISPETARMLKRVCGQRRSPMPTLKLLPQSAPVILTYGWSPQTARMVVSQGLLSQLQDDEIAVLYASQLAHIAHREFAVLSWVTLVAAGLHLVYSRVAIWGDRKRDRVLRSLATLISAPAYGAYRFCRWSGLGLARLRLYESDRAATELTGNPNALTRSLLKLSIGVSQEIAQQGQTPLLLEVCDLLTPVGYRSALSFGSLFPRHPTTQLLRWDNCNPYRQWLAVNHAHPPLGDRLYRLNRYARYWHLPTELDWETAPQPRSHPVSLRRFLLQMAPLTGLLVGLAIALSLWLIGTLAAQLDFRPLSWMAGDRSVLQGCLLVGLSLGTFLRINPFFPDIKAANTQVNPSLLALLDEVNQLPIDSQPVRLQGKLLGRQGIPACLNQDLLLETATGIVRLHYTSQWGWIGNLAAQSPRPQNWHRHPVIVTGWFHRGVTPWIEVDTIQSQQGKILKSSAPLLLTYLAGCAALLGVYIIANGSSF